MDELARKEQIVDQYVERDDAASAVKLLFELIAAHVENKNFTRAEALRDRLMEVDAMALDEIIKSGEMIENARSASVDQTHFETFTSLYKTLTTGETNALYYAMTEMTVPAGEIVFRQGERNSRLYFVNDGELKLVFSNGKQELLIHKPAPGQIVADDTFFSIIFCTTTLVAIRETRMTFIENRMLDTWREGFPGLEPKLRDFGLRQGKLYERIKSQGLERRSLKRFAVSFRASVQIRNAAGEAQGKPFKADLSDICAGGASFFIKTPKKEMAQKLLGRHLSLDCETKAVAPISVNGIIVAVNYHLYNDYSVHVRFVPTLAPESLKSLLPPAPAAK